MSPLATRYMEAKAVQLNFPGVRPFAVLRLDQHSVAGLMALLDDARQSGGRRWFLLSITADSLQRIKFLDLGRTPQYESRAAKHYLRAGQFRVTGRSGSCNIEFSTKGAELLREQLAAAQAEMRDWLEIRIHKSTSRRDHLLEFVPDTESEKLEVGSEAEKLGLAGQALFQTTLEAEDFSDWET